MGKDFNGQEPGDSGKSTLPGRTSSDTPASSPGKLKTSGDECVYPAKKVRVTGKSLERDEEEGKV